MRILLHLGFIVASSVAANVAGAEVDDAAARLDAALLQQLEVSPRYKPASYEVVPLVLPPLVDDATFLRRACIDIAGRLPTADEVMAFGAAKNKDKRSTLIDSLVQSSEAADWRFQRVADALRVKDTVGGHTMAPFVDWLRHEFREDTPWDQLVRRMLLAVGDQNSDPATGLLLRDAGKRLITASALTSTLIGVDLQCAQCHDHPFSDRTQMETYRMAACLPPVRARKPADGVKKTLLPGAKAIGHRAVRPVDPDEDVVGRGSWFGIAEGPRDLLPGMTLRSDYKYRDGKPGEVVTGQFIGFDRRRNVGSGFQTQITREDAANWFVSSQKDRLAGMMAMRMWLWMFGTSGEPADCREGDEDRREFYEVSGGSCCRGFSNTIRISRRFDDLANPGPSGRSMEVSSAFAKQLMIEFQKCHFDLREFQRIVGRTVAYQRQAIAESDADRGRGMLRPAPVVRRLPSEVLWDALQRWLPGTTELSVQLPQVVPVTHPLRLFGRGSREWSDESEALISHGLARFICNGPTTERCSTSLGSLSGTERLFETILARSATEAETTAAALSELAPSDIAWALINTSEFLFQH